MLGNPTCSLFLALEELLLSLASLAHPICRATHHPSRNKTVLGDVLCGWAVGQGPWTSDLVFGRSLSYSVPLQGFRANFQQFGDTGHCLLLSLEGSTLHVLSTLLVVSLNAVSCNIAARIVRMAVGHIAVVAHRFPLHRRP